MKHVICYACNKLGHIAKECKKKVQAPHQKDKTSSHLKIWKKRKYSQKNVAQHNVQAQQTQKELKV